MTDQQVELTQTCVDETIHFDEKFNKYYLNKNDVSIIYYYDSHSSTLFKMDRDKDAIDEKIYLNVISKAAQKQFDANKEGVVRVESKYSSLEGLFDKFDLRTELTPNEEVFVQKEAHNKSWQRGRVLEFSKERRSVKVELLGNYVTSVSASLDPIRIFVPFERVSYQIPPYVLLSKAFRVVCKIIIKNGQVNFLAGRIIELAKKANRFRYLVYFESGIASYVQRKDVSVILDQSKGFENFNSFQREFLSFYFKSYPEVPLAKFRPGDKAQVRLKMPNQSEELYIKTTGVVTKTDNKLVQFYIRTHDSHVWLYRGDFTRILSINNPEIKSNDAVRRYRPIRRTNSHQQNIIEVTIEDEIEDDEESNSEETPLIIEEQSLIQQEDLNQRETMLPSLSIIPNASEICKIELNQYTPHTCTRSCLSPRENENLLQRGINMYVIPIVFGWKRLYDIEFDLSKNIFYLSPCGKKFYDLETIFDFIQLTDSKLQIDQFNLDPNFVIEEDDLPDNKYYIFVKDISKETEFQPVSLINTIDTSYLPHFEYLAKREFNTNVSIVFDKNFLVCCDCVDDCRNSDKCACQLLTKESSMAIHEFDNFPLKNRILSEKILTGIYECNSGCSCRRNKERCANRNAQLGLRNKLQIFKTIDKGWGVRTLHDIPKGSFICTYAGIVLDDKTAEEEGKKNGDTYLADLDLIENLENAKVESRLMHSFSLEEGQNADSQLNNLRQLYGELAPYSINGSHRGNIGRFLNHSCDPNSFAQNVFVDTHDLRFPWLSFYALRHIPANTEITWDYSYEIDAVPHKRINCNCRSNNCRGRLL